MSQQVTAPLVFRVEPAPGGRFSWSLVDPATDHVLARGASYERRREAKDAIRLVARHAAHAQLEDRT